MSGELRMEKGGLEVSVALHCRLSFSCEDKLKMLIKVTELKQPRRLNVELGGENLSRCVKYRPWTYDMADMIKKYRAMALELEERRQTSSEEYDALVGIIIGFEQMKEAFLKLESFHAQAVSKFLTQQEEEKHHENCHL